MRDRLLVLGIAGLLVPSACSLSSEGVSASATGSATASSASASAGGGTAGAGGTGGSGGAGASGGGAAGPGGSGAGGAGETNCFDGVDNDGDSKTDCADEDCVSIGATCVRVPVGVSTFAAVLPDASPCPAGMTGPEATTVCPGCGCMLTSAGTCASKALFHASTDCKDASPVEVALTNGCTMHAAVLDGSVEGLSNPGGMGSCTSDNSVPVPTAAEICTTPVGAGAGCKGAQFCAPSPKPCILLPNADVPCPVGYYKTTLIRQGATACTSCADCTVGDQVCGAPDFTVYDDNNSCNSGTDVVQSGACTILKSTSQVSVMQQSDTAASGAQCSGFASPEGGPEPLQKVCCQ